MGIRSVQLSGLSRAVCTWTSTGYVPGGFSKSTPRRAWRRSTAAAGVASECSLETCQKGTLFEFHSAVTWVNGLRLCTSRRSKRPWLETGVLNFTVTPGTQHGGIFAAARDESKNNPNATRGTIVKRN